MFFSLEISFSLFAGTHLFYTELMIVILIFENIPPPQKKTRKDFHLDY